MLDTQLNRPPLQQIVPKHNNTITITHWLPLLMLLTVITEFHLCIIIPVPPLVVTQNLVQFHQQKVVQVGKFGEKLAETHAKQKKRNLTIHSNAL